MSVFTCRLCKVPVHSKYDPARLCKGQWQSLIKCSVIMWETVHRPLCINILHILWNCSIYILRWLNGYSYSKTSIHHSHKPFFQEYCSILLVLKNRPHTQRSIQFDVSFFKQLFSNISHSKILGPDPQNSQNDHFWEKNVKVTWSFWNVQ